MTPIRRDLMVLTAVAAVLFLPWLGARDLWNPNEPLYGQAVSEMAANGDWLIPSVNGEIFAEKPILYFWLARAAAAAFGGVGEWTLRLPSALAGIASVLLVYLLARPYVGRRRARMAALLLTTTFIVFWSARQVQMDLLLMACVLGAVLGATRALDGVGSAAAGWTISGVAAGLGFLAKGPVGAVLPALAISAYLTLEPTARRSLRGSAAYAVVAFVAVAAPWYLLLWIRGETSVLGELLVRQNLLRFVEPWDHQAPWWYYLKYFWIDMAPWAWFVPLAWGLEPRDDRERKLIRLSRGWIVVVVLFFSLSASKRSPYILPVAPAAAILVAGLVDRWLDGTLGVFRARAILAITTVLSLGLVAGGVVLGAGSPWIENPPAGIVTATWAMVVALCAGGAALLAATIRRRGPTGVAVAGVAAVAGIYLFAAATALPAANAFKSHRPFGEAIRSHVGSEDALHGFHAWRWRASYSYYTGRPIPNLETVEDLRRYWRRPERVFLIVERGRLDEARHVTGTIEPLATGAVGNNLAYLFANRDP